MYFSLQHHPDQEEEDSLYRGCCVPIPANQPPFAPPELSVTTALPTQTVTSRIVPSSPPSGSSTASSSSSMQVCTEVNCSNTAISLSPKKQKSTHYTYNFNFDLYNMETELLDVLSYCMICSNRIAKTSSKPRINFALEHYLSHFAPLIFNHTRCDLCKDSAFFLSKSELNSHMIKVHRPFLVDLIKNWLNDTVKSGAGGLLWLPVCAACYSYEKRHYKWSADGYRPLGNLVVCRVHCARAKCLLKCSPNSSRARLLSTLVDNGLDLRHLAKLQKKSESAKLSDHKKKMIRKKLNADRSIFAIEASAE